MTIHKNRLRLLQLITYIVAPNIFKLQMYTYMFGQQTAKTMINETSTMWLNKDMISLYEEQSVLGTLFGNTNHFKAGDKKNGKKWQKDGKKL